MAIELLGSCRLVLVDLALHHDLVPSTELPRLVPALLLSVLPYALEVPSKLLRLLEADHAVALPVPLPPSSEQVVEDPLDLELLRLLLLLLVWECTLLLLSLGFLQL